MKCQHCGINFDDGEKTCPVCGARAGSRGRLSEPRKFPFQPKTVRPKAKERTEYESVQSEIDPEYESVRTTAQHQSHSHEAQPLGRKARPSAKPIRENRVKGSRTAAIVVAAIVFLLNIAPAFIGFVTDRAANLFDTVPDFLYDVTDGIDGYEYDTDDEKVELEDLLGTENYLPLDDGTQLYLRAMEQGDDSEQYTLGVLAPDGQQQYIEMGTIWCTKESDSWYDEDNFPSDQYDFYIAVLTRDTEAESNSFTPEWRENIGDTDLWLCVYVNRNNGSICLQDMDNVGLFGSDNTIYPLTTSGI